MLFIHTIDKVLSGEKTQTSRLWKDDYIDVHLWNHIQSANGMLYSHKISSIEYIKKNNRKLYYVGQILSAQPARGAKGMAKIRILELAKRDVRNFTDEDITREGFDSRLDFYKVWYGMHFSAYVKLLADGYVDYDWWLDSIKAQTPEKNTALVIRFELVKD